MIAPSINMTYNGGPMEKLQELIGKRQKWLHETYKDSVVATAITALQSIRAATKIYSGKIADAYVFTMTRREDVHLGFVGRRRCVRAGRFPRKGAPRVDLGKRCVQLVPPGDRMWRQASVWKVEVTDQAREHWTRQPAVFHVIAASEQIVRQYLQKRFGNIAKRSGGLAKHVLGLAMKEVSTRPPAGVPVGEHAKKIAPQFVTVVIKDGDAELSVYIRDDLEYAVDALNGGHSAVDGALKRAANRIAGMIRHKAGARLDEDLSSPFPEVKRK